MPQLQRFILHSLTGKIFLCLLAIAYLGYLVILARFVGTAQTAPGEAIVVHALDTSPAAAVKHWTAASMRAAIDADQHNGGALALGSNTFVAGQAARQEGQPPRNGEASYPLSTVGKIFFSNAAGQDMTCSGTAVASLNHSVVDTAGHCLYLNSDWVQNVIFCPLYDNGSTPYGCWAARDLEVPSDWIHAGPNDYHHDFGMAIVASNSQGLLTNLVGGAGWAYNQAPEQPFYAYGYPAGYPFDGQSRRACEGALGKVWQHGGGSVVSIPCDMTAGSSGGPWFIQVDGTWYLNGHIDFTSSIQAGHMFSPYYDDTWFSLYDRAQQT